MGKELIIMNPCVGWLRSIFEAYLQDFHLVHLHNNVMLRHKFQSSKINIINPKFMFNEFSTATKQMYPDKAYGPDGLNPALFQQFWLIIGHEFCDYFKEWLASCSFPANHNDINVVLILKKECVSCTKDLRPIALYNVMYKILAKVLANRLRIILSNLIS